MTKTKWPSLARTEAALKEWERGAPAREVAWNTTENNEELMAVMQADLRALASLHDAFYEDTKDRNSRERCGLLGVETIREWVRQWREQEDKR